MTSIFGVNGFFDSDKVQNQTAIPSYTNFNGSVAINGQPATTGGPYLPLSGGTMSGSISMGSSNNVADVYQLGLAPCGDPVTPGSGLNLYGYAGVLKYRSDDSSDKTIATTTDLESYLPLAGGFMTGVIDSVGALSLGTGSATSVSISRAGASTTIGGKAYVAGTRPVMSGGFTMLTPVTLANSTVETSLIGAGLGSLTSPANSVSVGQSSHSVSSGNLSITGSPTLTIRLKGGPTSATTLATWPIALATISANAAWKLTSDYTVKAIGAAGVAQIYINSVFVVFDTINPPTYAHFSLNTTTYDTTVANVATVTAQWSAASASNTITCQQFTTNSVYTP